MRKSLVICGINYYTSKKVAKIFSLILGASKIVDMSNISEDFATYDNIVIIIGPHGINNTDNIRKYLKIIKQNVLNSRIGIIGVAIPIRALYEYVDTLAGEIMGQVDVIELIQGNLDTKEVCNTAKKASEVFSKPALELPRKELIEEIEKYILQHNTCVLATGSGNFIRSTPIEYTYTKGKFYFVTEGGLKFAGILENPKVSISIFNEYEDMQHLKGLQVSGNAEIVNSYGEEYNEVMKIKKIDIKRLKNMPVNLNLIKVEVNRFEFLNSNLKHKDVDLRQVLLM